MLQHTELKKIKQTCTAYVYRPFNPVPARSIWICSRVLKPYYLEKVRLRRLEEKLAWPLVWSSFSSSQRTDDEPSRWGSTYMPSKKKEKDFSYVASEASIWKELTKTKNCKLKVAQLCLTLRAHGLYSPWNSPGQDTGVGSLSLLQGNLSNPGMEPRSPHCRQIFYQLSDKGGPNKTGAQTQYSVCFEMREVTTELRQVSIKRGT